MTQTMYKSKAFSSSKPVGIETSGNKPIKAVSCPPSSRPAEIRAIDQVNEELKRLAASKTPFLWRKIYNAVKNYEFKMVLTEGSPLVPIEAIIKKLGYTMGEPTLVDTILTIPCKPSSGEARRRSSPQVVSKPSGSDSGPVSPIAPSNTKSAMPFKKVPATTPTGAATPTTSRSATPTTARSATPTHNISKPASPSGIPEVEVVVQNMSGESAPFAHCGKVKEEIMQHFRGLSFLKLKAVITQLTKEENSIVNHRSAKTTIEDIFLQNGLAFRYGMMFEGVLHLHAFPSASPTTRPVYKASSSPTNFTPTPLPGQGNFYKGLSRRVKLPTHINPSKAGPISTEGSSSSKAAFPSTKQTNETNAFSNDTPSAPEAEAPGACSEMIGVASPLISNLSPNTMSLVGHDSLFSYDGNIEHTGGAQINDRVARKLKFDEKRPSSAPGSSTEIPNTLVSAQTTPSSPATPPNKFNPDPQCDSGYSSSAEPPPTKPNTLSGGVVSFSSVADALHALNLSEEKFAEELADVKSRIADAPTGPPPIIKTDTKYLTQDLASKSSFGFHRVIAAGKSQFLVQTKYTTLPQTPTPPKVADTGPSFRRMVDQREEAPTAPKGEEPKHSKLPKKSSTSSSPTHIASATKNHGRTSIPRYMPTQGKALPPVVVTAEGRACTNSRYSAGVLKSVSKFGRPLSRSSPPS